MEKVCKTALAPRN